MYFSFFQLNLTQLHSKLKTMKPILIEKEDVRQLSFKNKTDKQISAEILKKLEEATLLGNSVHHKVHIVFEDDESVKEIYTTIWATGTHFICIKGGLWIPINRILEVSL